ncbi:MAG: hypothetical protein Kow0068_18210 [Marinilabiliales bacterium]
MKLFGIFLLSLLCLGNQEPLKLINATSYKWSSGVQGMKGEKYSFVLLAGKSSNVLKINKVWVGEQSLDFKVFKLGESAQYKNFEKGDTIMIICEHIINTKNPDNNTNNINKEEASVYKGAAIIYYTVGKKEKSIVIKEIKNSKQLNYQ